MQRGRLSIARLFADEDFPLPVIHELRRLGHDAVTNRRLVRAVRMVPAVSGEFLIFGPCRARCEAWVGPKRT